MTGSVFHALARVAATLRCIESAAMPAVPATAALAIAVGSLTGRTAAAPAPPSAPGITPGVTAGIAAGIAPFATPDPIHPALEVQP